MPTKQVNHKTVSVRLDTYDELLELMGELTKEKGVPVTLPTVIQLLLDRWKGVR